MRAERNPSSTSSSWWRPLADAACVALLVCVACFGFAREWRAAFVTRPILKGLGAPGRTDTILAAFDRFGRQFSRTHRYGLDDVNGMLNTPADFLLTGGSCGVASQALGTVFDQMGQAFRILHVNVNENWGATHVMVEARAEDGRWLLLDASESAWFPDPTTGRPMTFDEIRARNPETLALQDARYREVWNLWGPYRRTNWDHLPIAGPVLAHVLPASVRDEFSLRAVLIEPGGEIASISLLILAYLLQDIVRRALRQRAPSLPVSAAVMQMAPQAVVVDEAKQPGEHAQA